MTLPDCWTEQKPRRNCPICGVESTGGKQCSYHAKMRKQHARKAMLYRVRKLTDMIGECVEEARA